MREIPPPVYPDLYLTNVTEQRVEFDAYIGDRIQKVTVLVGSNLITFPHLLHESGQSFGSEEIDHLVCLRAFEEITRLRCYKAA